MNDNQRWRARRDRALGAALVRQIKRTHADVCRKHLPDWPEEKVAAAFTMMSAEGLIGDIIDLAAGMSDEQWAAFRNAAEQARGEE